MRNRISAVLLASLLALTGVACSSEDATGTDGSEAMEESTDGAADPAMEEEDPAMEATE